MKIAIFVRKNDPEIVAVRAKVFFENPPAGSTAAQLQDNTLRRVKQTMEADKWEYFKTIEPSETHYFMNRVNAEFIGHIEDIATRIASVMYFQGSAHGHNEALMERR